MDIDASLFPFKSWAKCEQRAINKEIDLMQSFTDPKGIYRVRESIARLISITRGVKCYPEQIIMGASTQYLLQILINMLPSKSQFGVENPGYHRVHRLLKKFDKNVVTIDLDENGAMMEDIEKKKPDILFITPSHQFPTGTIMPISRRIELLNWVSGHSNRYIIEDDYDSEFKYESDTIPALQSLDRYEKVIYLGTFSKSLLPGLRISYMVLPQKLVIEHKEEYKDMIQTCSILSQLTLVNFIESGEYQKHIKKMSNIYNSRRQRLLEELHSKFGENIDIFGSSAGLHFCASFQTTAGYEDILTRAKENKIEIYPMTRFLLERIWGNEGWISFIIGFANISEDRIKEGVERLFDIIYNKN
jgi:GntR family transcriptional regulator / MocR family aminotransferase